MPADEMSDQEHPDIAEVTRRLLRPYTIRADTPYLSEDQRRLSELPLEERFEWMAEWLRWAADTPDREPNDWGER
jgi:hypothetical protein